MRLIFVCLLLLAGCSKQPAPTTFQKPFPEQLSAWGMVLSSGKQLKINDTVEVYDLATPLFSDYAHKLRTVWVPPGTQADFGHDLELSLPVGSVVTKTFYYEKSGTDLQLSRSSPEASTGLDLSEVQLIETRVLVRLESGWQGLPYVWNAEQTDAVLEITGAAMALELKDDAESLLVNYTVPDINQCKSCHVDNLASKEMRLLGLRARHLSTAQMDQFQAAGLLDGNIPEHTKNTDWLDTSAQLNARARSYLDINCGHCHNPTGPADTSGMFLHHEETESISLGVCKPPIAAGQGTGGRLVGIQPGSPEGSILSYRMHSLDLGAMMPELGRSVVHAEGVTLIDDWITSLAGDC